MNTSRLCPKLCIITASHTLLMMRAEACPRAIDAMRLLLWSAAACSSTNGLRYTAVCSTNGLRYSAVLPSPNPGAPVNNDARGRRARFCRRGRSGGECGLARRCLPVPSGWVMAALQSNASHWNCTLECSASHWCTLSCSASHWCCCTLQHSRAANASHRWREGQLRVASISRL